MRSFAETQGGSPSLAQPGAASRQWNANTRGRQPNRATICASALGPLSLASPDSVESVGCRPVAGSHCTLAIERLLLAAEPWPPTTSRYEWRPYGVVAYRRPIVGRLLMAAQYRPPIADRLTLAADSSPPIARALGRQSLAADDWPPTIGRLVLVARHLPPTTESLLLAANYWPLTIDRRLLAAHHRPPIIGRPLIAASDSPPTTDRLPSTAAEYWPPALDRPAQYWPRDIDRQRLASYYGPPSTDRQLLATN